MAHFSFAYLVRGADCFRVLQLGVRIADCVGIPRGMRFSFSGGSIQVGDLGGALGLMAGLLEGRPRVALRRESLGGSWWLVILNQCIHFSELTLDILQKLGVRIADCVGIPRGMRFGFSGGSIQVGDLGGALGLMAGLLEGRPRVALRRESLGGSWWLVILKQCIHFSELTLDFLQLGFLSVQFALQFRDPRGC